MLDFFSYFSIDFKTLYKALIDGSSTSNSLSYLIFYNSYG